MRFFKPKQLSELLIRIIVKSYYKFKAAGEIVDGRKYVYTAC